MHAVLGTAAGILGSVLSISYLAQTTRIWRRRSSGDVSLIPFGINLLGAVLWVGYGLTNGIDLPLVVANAIGILTLTTVLAVGVAYRSRSQRIFGRSPDFDA